MLKVTFELTEEERAELEDFVANASSVGYGTISEDSAREKALKALQEAVNA